MRNVARKTKQQLLQEIEDLQSELAEAQETFRAIREGEVDAVIVSGSRGEQVFSLVGAESIYRLIVETMKEAAFTVTFDGEILYCNAQFGDFVKRPPNQILGHKLTEFVDPANRSAADTLLTIAQGQPVKQRMVFAYANGGLVPAHISANVLNQPDGLSICIVATDLTELENSTEMIQRLRRQQEALQAANEDLAAAEEELRAQNEELVASELELDRARARYQDLFETAPHGYIGTNEEGIIQEVNQAAARMFGRTAAVLKGNPFSALLPGSEREAYLGLLACMNAREAPPTKWELELRPPECPPFWAAVTAAASRSEDGNIVGLRWLIQDVTERKQAEEALRRSEQQVRLFMRDAFVSADMAGRIQDFNPAYQQMLGYTREELRRLTYMDITPEKWQESESRILREQVLPWGNSDIYEKEYRRKDGTVFPVELRRYLIRNETGDAQGVWAMVRDISERKRADEALRLSEERFRQVAETVSDFVWEVDADGLYTYTSPAVEKILGYTPDEMVGIKHFYELFAPDVREQLKIAVSDVFIARRRFHAFPNNNVHKNGQIVCLETSGVPILSENGRLLGYRGADTDVTERNRAEAETQRLREELAHFSRVAAMSELTASIAHELNQPLAAILSNAEAALRLLHRAAPDLKEVREILGDVVADDQRAAEVIRSLRDMIKGGGRERHSLLLNDLIKDVLSIVRHEGLAREVSIILDFASPLPLITGDRVQLQQVILNLVINAFEAMEASEKPRELKLRTRQSDFEIILDVMDSGSGISHDKLDTIFEPFFTTKKTGLGMGLSLSRSIVRSHNGRLWADKNTEHGATFHIALPIAKGSIPDEVNAGLYERKESVSRQTMYPDAGRIIRVLLADDHEVVRKGIANLLRSEKDIKIVGAAADGQEAVELAVKLLPDIILMDINMPKLDGVEATRIIHDVNPQICIIGFSIFEEVERIQAMRAGGASLYLRKGARAEELISAIRNVTRNACNA